MVTWILLALTVVFAAVDFRVGSIIMRRQPVYNRRHFILITYSFVWRWVWVASLCALLLWQVILYTI